ncbi:MAG: antitoxin [Verrucomicrobia bacterium]|nr:antitoxin [Verrucomicrobiota bacterium]
MRTTLTLDEDVAEFLKEQSRLQERPFKQIVNEMIRRGMQPALQNERAAFKVSPNRSGVQSGIDPKRLNQLNDELEVEDFSGEASR